MARLFQVDSHIAVTTPRQSTRFVCPLFWKGSSPKGINVFSIGSPLRADTFSEGSCYAWKQSGSHKNCLSWQKNVPSPRKPCMHFDICKIFLCTVFSCYLLVVVPKWLKRCSSNRHKYKVRYIIIDFLLSNETRISVFDMQAGTINLRLVISLIQEAFLSAVLKLQFVYQRNKCKSLTIFQYSWRDYTL